MYIKKEKKEIEVGNSYRNKFSALWNKFFVNFSSPGECLSVREGVKLPTQSICERCGHVSSQPVCKACVLLEGLNKGRPRLGIGKSSKVQERLGENHKKEVSGKNSQGSNHVPNGVALEGHAEIKSLDF